MRTRLQGASKNAVAGPVVVVVATPLPSPGERPRPNDDGRMAGQVPSPKTSRAHRHAGRQSSKPTHATYFWSFFAIIRGGSACVSWSIRKLMARFLRSVIGVSFLETKFRGLACNVYSFKSDLIIACMCDNASVFVYDDDVIILSRLSNCHTHGSRIFMNMFWRNQCQLHLSWVIKFKRWNKAFT